jgi:AcrR family transcriptional regulator
LVVERISMSSTVPAERGGLRARKKAAAMRQIQRSALALFRERGFDSVRIEEVAAAAEVSPSTVYRYFGTKEGLVLRDEFDERILTTMVDHLQGGDDPWIALGRALAVHGPEHFGDLEADSRERFRLWMSTPSIQAAAHLVVDEMVDEIAGLMASTGHWTFPQGRVIVSGMIWPLLAALRNWHEAGGDQPWFGYVAEALHALGREDVVEMLHQSLE